LIARDPAGPQRLQARAAGAHPCRYYLRLTVKDQPGVLARVASVMAGHHVSIASVIQNPAETAGAASLVLTTHQSNEKAMRPRSATWPGWPA
jgi:glycine cleavage system regulatory protein